MSDSKSKINQPSSEEHVCLSQAIKELRELTNKYSRTTEGDLGFRSDATEATNALLGQVAFEKYKECKAIGLPKNINSR